MRRIIEFLPLFVVVAVVAVFIYAHIEHKKEKEEKASSIIKIPEKQKTVAPESETMSSKERALVKQALEAPASIDAQAIAQERSIVQEMVVVAEPPRLISERTPDPLPKAVVRTNTPAYFEPFASLRKPAVRDPHSEQNREAVRNMMKKRATRIAELEERRKVEL